MAQEPSGEGPRKQLPGGWDGGSPEAREWCRGVAPEGGKIEELLELTSPEEAQLSGGGWH